MEELLRVPELPTVRTSRTRARSRRRRLVLLGAGVMVAHFVAACGVVLDAPTITLIARPGEIVYAQADGESALVGGETILVVRNSSDVHRQIVLAHVGSAGGSDDIPEGIREAELARDDDRILGMSLELDPEETDFSAGGFGKKTASTRFHVYLRPGDRYVLFDRLSLDDDPLVAWLEPRPRGDE